MGLFFALPAPTDWTLKPVFDLRERFERRIDKDFSEAGSDNRSDLFSRWRVGVDFGYRKEFSGRIVYQYAHNLFWTAAQNASAERSDMFVGYLDFKALDGKLRLGRQQLFLGSERLLGESNWGNTSRSFDMVRWTGKGLDLFAGRMAVNSTPSKDAFLAGAQIANRLGDTYLIFKHDKKGSDDIDTYTLDHTFHHKRGKWSGDMDIALQRGRVGDTKQEGWAAGLKANYQHDPKWKLYGEVAAASGGKRGNTILTFDQIFASNHARYGIMDLQGWRNMTGLSLGVNFKSTKQLSLSAEFHKFGLMSSKDGLYSDGGSKGLVDPTGASGKDVGQEFDLMATYTVDAKSVFEVGFGIFQPGRFINSFSGKGDRDQVWGYFQYRLKF